MAVSYGELATCPIADFSDLFAEEKQNPVSGEDAAQIFTENTNSVPAEHAKATAGQKIFFVVTKTLELMAIPLLAVVTVALAPIMLPVFGPFVLVGHLAKQRPLIRIGYFFLLPARTMARMVQWTLFGKKIDIEPLTKDQELLAKKDVKKLNYGLISAEKFTKSMQVCGIGVTALAVVAVVVTVALFFATALIPLVVLWPVVAVCGCAAILGVAIFGWFLYLSAQNRRRHKELFCYL